MTKTINNRSIHMEHTRDRSLSYGNFHTEHINMGTHFLNAHWLPKGSALGILACSELACRVSDKAYRL